MEIQFAKQLSSNEVWGLDLDLFIYAENHEERYSECLKMVKAQNTIKKIIAFTYKSLSPPNSAQDDTVRLCIENTEQIIALLHSEIPSESSRSMNLFVDYSCMTKAWYYSIILFLTNRNLKFGKINAYFSYTPSIYSEPLEPRPNTEIAPLPGKYIVPTDKPKALIVCLGYEQSKAEGIIDHLDPHLAYVFYTKPTLDLAFEEKIEQNNKNILVERSTTTITYKFDDLVDLERKLTAVYFEHKGKYSIIIAPLGPKPFSFIAMVLSAKYDDIDIWRVDSGSDINMYVRKPIPKTFIICQLVVE